jgi:hypothetical protein
LKPEVSKASLKSLFDETQEVLLLEADRYGLPRGQIEPRIWAKARLILAATTAVEAQTASKRVISSLRFHLQVLSYYAHRIPGPCTPETLEKKAKQAESLAKMQEKFGKDEAAAKQRLRAKTLLAKAETMRSGVPSKQVRHPLNRRKIIRAPARSRK